jgi:hypothetical protein
MSETCPECGSRQIVEGLFECGSRNSVVEDRFIQTDDCRLAIAEAQLTALKQRVAELEGESAEPFTKPGWYVTYHPVVEMFGVVGWSGEQFLKEFYEVHAKGGWKIFKVLGMTEAVPHAVPTEPDHA